MEYYNLPYNELIKRNEPLSRYTTFGIGGTAEIFAEPRNSAELKEFIEFGRDSRLPINVIGKGSNVLVNDSGVRGIVIYLARNGFKRVKRENSSIIAGAGVSLPLLVNKSVGWGLGGLEVLTGIPGTVGGAVASNAGGKYGTISECIMSVTTIDIDGRTHQYNREDIDFGYRKNCFLNQIIIEAMLKLKECNRVALLKRSREILQEKNLRQPLSAKSAGCVFKNPEGYCAGALIEQAGLKGQRVGGAIVSEKHANFIINTGNATAVNVLELVDAIKGDVLRKFNILLELEIQVW
ncbi:MAG: UDP-N-acetylmuramate dehydrogenase [Planctomycetes bacterium]|nr:UDP-N-acetylmuramate dehydrogenase [Planctomycetota bacterium]